MWQASLDSPAGARPARHVVPAGLREPLDAAARGPDRAARRRARAVRLDREAAPAAVIVPLDGDDVWLVSSTATPSGGASGNSAGRLGGDPDVPAEALARGELAEETGLRAGEGAAGHALLRLRDVRPALRRVARDGLEPGAPAPEATEQDLRCERFAVGRVRGDDPARRDRRRGDRRRVAPRHTR